MRSHRPRARHGISCERRYSGRCEEVATKPACLIMEFVQEETFQARLERDPLPQHDEMGLGQAIASLLTAYTAIRSSSNRFSQLAGWFQLAKMRLTKSVLFVVDNLLAASPSRGASFACWPRRVSKRGRVRHEHCQTALPICPSNRSVSDQLGQEQRHAVLHLARCDRRPRSAANPIPRTRNDLVSVQVYEFVQHPIFRYRRRAVIGTNASRI